MQLSFLAQYLLKTSSSEADGDEADFMMGSSNHILITQIVRVKRNKRPSSVPKKCRKRDIDRVSSKMPCLCPFPLTRLSMVETSSSCNYAPFSSSRMHVARDIIDHPRERSTRAVSIDRADRPIGRDRRRREGWKEGPRNRAGHVYDL